MAGLLPAAIYAWVGTRVRRLKKHVRGEALNVMEVVIVQHHLRAPGLAILYADQIELFRIVGKPIVVKLTDVSSARKIDWFNGKLLWWKTAYEIKTVNDSPVCVAMPKPAEPAWRTLLFPNGKPAPFETWGRA